ncbi:MAG: 1-acyl-sn-glycerol-3-phosphate acyltransferase [Lentimicrobiaceae bacterium]|nr:1-acyl-sn-glycerol-3-phosphate acyltransferase [Lentimicrobiaceae bacterium]
MFTFTISERTIDVQQTLKEKAPKVYRKLPGFVFPLLRKILHEKEVNGFLYKERDKTGIDFATAILEDFGCKVSVTGMEKLPPEGRFLLCANHPLGGLDGMAFLSRMGQWRKNLLFPVNSILLALPPFQSVFLPINTLQKNTENRRALEDAFNGSATILYFPAGKCSRKGKKGVIADLEWKKTFITQARKSQRDVIPVHISGKNSNFFYNLANLRTKLGLKANIEQAFLVNEMFKLHDQEIRLTVGTPIPCGTFDSRHTDKEWAALVREHVYRLSTDPEAEFKY